VTQRARSDEPDAPAPQISEGLQVLPGVEALLVALAARANCVTGLVRRHLRRRPHAVLTRFAQVTGNLEPIGWAKMEALGLKRHFSKPLVGGCAPLRRV
jgi:hypothetical protein